jgi:hypothetical protein
MILGILFVIASVSYIGCSSSTENEIPGRFAAMRDTISLAPAGERHLIDYLELYLKKAGWTFDDKQLRRDTVGLLSRAANLLQNPDTFTPKTFTEETITFFSKFEEKILEKKSHRISQYQFRGFLVAAHWIVYASERPDLAKNLGSNLNTVFRLLQSPPLDSPQNLQRLFSEMQPLRELCLEQHVDAECTKQILDIAVAQTAVLFRMSMEGQVVKPIHDALIAKVFTSPQYENLYKIACAVLDRPKVGSFEDRDKRIIRMLSN